MRIITNQRKIKKVLLSVIACVLIAALVFCAYYFDWLSLKKEGFVSPEIDKSQFSDIKLSDNASLYNEADKYSLYEAYLTVYTGTDEETGGVFDWNELNLIDGLHPDPLLDSSLNIYDPNTGEYIFSGNPGINSTVCLRGQSARTAEQKSYKIKLFDNAGTFQGQQVLNLNKHSFDYSRFTQKFCYDYMTILTDFVSLRTYFFRLWVLDATNPGAGYVNYGLFTHVEQPNKSFLQAHGLDVTATVYKPSDFEFFENDTIIAHDDDEFDYDQFSKLLKIRENPDNEKLAQMLADINDESKNFDEVFAKYFDLDNYLTWCAVNLLFNNYDTMSRNFMLYSPSYSDKWYFIPWDYDACMFSKERFEDSAYYPYFGLSRYWGTVIHKRFFKDPSEQELLDDKMDEIYAAIMQTDVAGNCQKYLDTVLEAYLNSPDAISDETSVENIRIAAADFPNRLTYYYNLYYETKEKPMPIFLGTPTMNYDGTLTFNWSPSYDLQADRLYYVYSIFTDPENIEGSTVLTYDTSLTSYICDAELPNGTYFWRVVIYDGKGNTQISFERLVLEDTRGLKHYYFGIKRFVIENGMMIT